MAALDRQGPGAARQRVVGKSYNDIQMSDNARGHIGDVYGEIDFAVSVVQAEKKQHSSKTRSSTFLSHLMRHSMHTIDRATQTAYLGPERIFTRRCTSGLMVMGRAVYFG